MSDSSDDEPLAVKRAKLDKQGPATQKPAAKVQKQPQVKAEVKQEAEPPAARSRKQKSKTQDAQGKAASKSAQKSAKGSSANKTKMVAVKREKKKFDLPGQTRDTPDELDPLRKFYASLRIQRPGSLMARKWMCMYGLLSLEEAEAFLEEAGKTVKSPVKKERASQGSRNKAKSAAGRKSTPARRKKPATSIKEEVDDDDNDSSEAEVMPKAKRPRVKKESTAATPPKKKPPPSKGKFAVFEDGPMDTDSDDDKPLGLRV